jgi:uncharacterized membrane protein
MKVLLINNNPVVGKLVTLSAQKTGDELSSVHSVEDVAEGEYDFVLMDDAGYSDDLFDELRTKAKFRKSCFIGSRSTEKPSGFTHVINKPFLPTDLVDIFIKVSSDTKTQDEGTPVSEEILPDDGLDDNADMTDNLDGLEDDLLGDTADEVIDLEDLDALDSLDEDFDDDLDLEDLNDDLELGDLDEKVEEAADEVAPTDEVEHQSVLDDDDVKEVQDLLIETEELSDELNEPLLEDDTQTAGSSFADEATLEEINNALEEIDEENEDDDAISLDDALDAFKAEEVTSVTADTLGNFDSLDLEDEIGLDEEAEDDTTDMLEDDEKGMSDLLDELELDEQNDEAGLDLGEDEDLDDLLDELDLDQETDTEQIQTENIAGEGSIEEASEGLEDIDISGILEEDEAAGHASNDTTALDKTLIDENLLDEIDLSEEGIAEEENSEGLLEEDEASVADEESLEELLAEDDVLDEVTDSDVSADDGEDLLDVSDLLEEDIGDDESLAGLLDEEDDLLDETDLLEEVASEEDEASIAEETHLEEALAEEPVLDEEDLDELLSATEDDLLAESDLLKEELTGDAEAVADEETMDELPIEEPDLSEASDLLEEIASEETEDDETFEDESEIEKELNQDPGEIDLSALNDEIEEALSELDEDDLRSEIDESDICLEDELASLNTADLKMALGEADAEDSEIQDEIEALESSMETEEELGLSVGQSEFASLNKEALSEARGDGLVDDFDHPELEEVNAFVDEVAVEGASSFDMSSKASADESIVTLENLISTLKQGNVKEALKGMEMNIKISFSEKSE